MGLILSLKSIHINNLHFGGLFFLQKKAKHTRTLVRTLFNQLIDSEKRSFKK